MDDNIISHVEQDAIEKVISTIEGYFWGLVIGRGNTLNFLGMEIQFKGNKTFDLSVVKYITNMIEDLEELLKTFGENLHRTCAHPTAKDLFTVKEKAAKLTEEKAGIFRTFIVKIIWTEKQGRLYVEPTMSFL